jgi:hypothetical protein
MLEDLQQEISSTGLILNLKQYNGSELDPDRGMHFLEFEVTNIDSLLKDNGNLQPTASKIKEVLLNWDQDVTPLVDLHATINVNPDGKTQSIEGTLTIVIIFFN